MISILLLPAIMSPFSFDFIYLSPLLFLSLSKVLSIFFYYFKKSTLSLIDILNCVFSLYFIYLCSDYGYYLPSTDSEFSIFFRF